MVVTLVVVIATFSVADAFRGIRHSLHAARSVSASIAPDSLSHRNCGSRDRYISSNAARNVIRSRKNPTRDDLDTIDDFKDEGGLRSSVDSRNDRPVFSRRVAVRNAITSFAAALTCGLAVGIGNLSPAAAIAGETSNDYRRKYVQRFPTLFSPLYGESTKRTIKRQLSDTMWSIEQNLELGPLQVPIRSVVIQLDDGTLWVHAPVAPTREFFDLVESCGSSDHLPEDRVAHVVVPTYALEHKVFTKDALSRWSKAKLWTSPGQFSFPIRSVPDSYIWGRDVSGVLKGSDKNAMLEESLPPWINEIEYETLEAGTFQIGSSPVTFYETAFFHKRSKTLIVTDSLIRVPADPPVLNDPELLLLVSKRSTADPQPLDTVDTRKVGWEKTTLLVSYFFPEHEELDPTRLGVVTWTEGWHDNFLALSGRLLVPPVVRTLIYGNNPASVQKWVDRVSRRWDFRCVVPAHFEAPIRASVSDFREAFAFLEDETIDAFPAKDLARGLQPIADIVRNTIIRP